MDSYDARSHDKLFSLFHKQVSEELAPKLTETFRHLVKVGNFSACWKLADFVLVPKELLPLMLEATSLSLLRLSYKRYLRMS